MPHNRTCEFLPLTGIFEPSGIQQLGDGRFLVAEDEKQHPFSLVSISAVGQVTSTPLIPGLQDDEIFWKLDDLEAVALDQSGYLYAITSHSRNEDGEEKKSREKLLRFRIENNRMTAPMLFRGLKTALITAHPDLASAAEILDVKNDGGLNIEAMEISPEQQHLLIGFRSPLLDKHAIIARIENPAAMFEDGALPHVSATLTRLDLGGHGLRSMSYLPALNGYLLISGPVAREQAQFQLWFWSGLQTKAARRITIPGLHGFEHAEGISAAVIDDRQCIIIVSDDGSREEERFARFLLLDLDQLQIAPD